jgi:hypothetical protein
VSETPKPELECLRSIDRSIRTVRTILIWWFVLSLVAIAAAGIYALAQVGT